VISSSDTKLNDSFSSPLYCSIAIQFKVLVADYWLLGSITCVLLD
jgi:hypothetical protein